VHEVRIVTTDQLLLQMSAVLFFKGQWHARAADCDHFGVGPTPSLAMQAAMELRDGPGWDLFT
jgi:hypothetical protein